MRIAVYCDLSVVVTLPFSFNLNLVDKFIQSKLAWIEKSLAYFQTFKSRPIVKFGKREYKVYRDEAKQLALAKVQQWNKFYGFNYNRVNIKNHKSRWGSCSRKGNLNFNYKILHLPGELQDYLVVHELCHLAEFNHSKNFWQLVGKAIPNYQTLRKQLFHV